MQHFAKYLAKSFSMQNNLTSFSIRAEVCFSVNYNFTFVIPEYILRILEYMKVISSHVFQVVVLNIFEKMLPSVAVVIRASRLWYNKSNSYLFCNKRFKVFLEVEMFEDQPTSLPIIKILLLRSCGLSSFLHSHPSLYIIYSLQV